MDGVFYELHDIDGVKTGRLPMEGNATLVITAIRNGVAQKLPFKLRMRDGVPMLNRNSAASPSGAVVPRLAT